MNEEIKCKKCGVKLLTANFGLLCKTCMSNNKHKGNNQQSNKGPVQKPMRSLRRSGRS
jgi:hypothetical protein